eukprot:m.34552 g.34552  ORF g.34552 m.34552 type:complete len:59 (+) comp43591_c0_seq1:372-548(+)
MLVSVEVDHSFSLETITFKAALVVNYDGTRVAVGHVSVRFAQILHGLHVDIDLTSCLL